MVNKYYLFSDWRNFDMIENQNHNCPPQNTVNEWVLEVNFHLGGSFPTRCPLRPLRVINLWTISRLPNIVRPIKKKRPTHTRISAEKQLIMAYNLSSYNFLSGKHKFGLILGSDKKALFESYRIPIFKQLYSRMKPLRNKER